MRDAEPEPPVPPTVVAWHADIVPVPVAPADDPTARTVVVVVVNGPELIHSRIIYRPPTELPALAAILASEIGEAVKLGGSSPTQVETRFEALAELTQALLADSSMVIAGNLGMRSLAPYALQAAEALKPGDTIGAGHSQPGSWLAWGHEAQTVASFFSAVARLRRARPWRIFSREHLVAVTLGNGARWVVAPTTSRERTAGTEFYSSQNDRALAAYGGGVERVITVLDDARISVDFGPVHKLSASMQVERAAQNWEIADDDSYPLLSVYNTPAGGVTASQFSELTGSMNALSEAVESHAKALQNAVRKKLILRLHLPSLNATVSLQGAAAEAFRMPWSLPQVLAPCMAQFGPGEPPAADGDSGGTASKAATEGGVAAAEVRDAAQAQARDAALAAGREWSEKVLDEYVASIQARPAATFEPTARSFVRFMLERQQCSLRNFSEYDLRLFVYDNCARERWVYDSDLPRPLTALRSFFAFLQQRHGVVCPWAADVVNSVEAFVKRSCAYPLEPAATGEAEYVSGEYERNDADLSRWNADLRYDLNQRVLLHDSGEYGSRIWHDPVPPEQVALHRSVQRSWLEWRDTVIAEGVTEAEDVRRLVLGRQREWARALVARAEARRLEERRKERRRREVDRSQRRSP